jgi:hypothetical protein
LDPVLLPSWSVIELPCFAAGRSCYIVAAIAVRHSINSEGLVAAGPNNTANFDRTTGYTTTVSHSLAADFGRSITVADPIPVVSLGRSTSFADTGYLARPWLVRFGDNLVLAILLVLL